MPSSCVAASPSPVEGAETITSEALTQASRAFFVRASADAGVDYADVNRTSGSVSYDACSTSTWIYECVNHHVFFFLDIRAPWGGCERKLTTVF